MDKFWRILVCAGAMSTALIPAAIPPAAWAQQGAAGTAAAAADPILGDYIGLDGAQSMVLAVHPQNEGYVIVFRPAPSGEVYNIEAEKAADGIEGAVDWRGGSGIMRVAPKGAGIVMIWAPLNAQKEPDRAATQAFAFVRRGTEMPKTGQFPAPRRGEKTTPAVFLQAYELWEPNAVQTGYEGLTDADRDLLRLYPLVMTDVLWKMCGATGGEGLAEALRGQSVTCGDIDAAISAGQSSGRFNAFKQQTANQRADALKAIECGRGLYRDAECAAAARKTQEIALSLQSVAGALQALKP